MASNVRKLAVEILGDASGAQKAMRSVEDSSQSLGDNMKRLGRGIAGAFATQQIASFAKDAVGAAMEDAKAQTLLAQQLKATTNATADQIAAVEQFIEKTQNSTGVLDDELRPALATFVRFTGDASKAQDLLTLAMDISAGTGKDLGTVSTALARAYAGNTAALARLGIQTKDASGEALEFDEIQQQLNKTFGGQTAAAAETAAGKMAIARANFESMKEEVGTALIPALGTLVDTLMPVVELFNNLPDGVQQVIVVTTLATAGFIAARNALIGLGVAGKTATTSLGVVGATLGIAATLYGLYSSSKKEAAQRTTDLAEALKLESTAQQTAIEKLVLSDDKTRKALESLDALGFTLDDLETYWKTGKGPLAAYAMEVDDLYEYGRDFNSIGKELTKTLGLNQKEVLNTFGSYEKFTEAVATLGPQALRLRDVYVKETEATKLVTDATDDATMAQRRAKEAAEADQEAQDELTAELEKQEEALRKVIAAQLSAFSSQLGYYESTWQTGDAIADFTQLQKDLEEGTYDGEDAYRDIAEALNAVYSATISQAAAAAKLAEDQAEASGATLSAAESAKIQVAELQKVTDALAPSSPLRRQLEAYITTLTTRIPSEIGTTLKLDIETQRALNMRANGGPVTGGMPYVVGERGPELFVPSSSGSIVPRIPATIGAGGGGNSYSITVNTSGVGDMSNVGAQVVDAIRAYERRNGTGWRR